MTIAKDTGGSDFKLPSPGPDTAICHLFVDVGLQPNSYNPEKPKHKCYIGFQLPNQQIEYEKDGHLINRPMTIGTFLTVSLSSKAIMRGFLESWRGRPFTDEELQGFDLAKLLNAPALLNIVHEPDGDKVYANIASVMPLPKTMAKPEMHGKVIYYDPDHKDGFDNLPEFLKKKIQAQVQPPAPTQAAPIVKPDLDDDIPF